MCKKQVGKLVPEFPLFQDINFLHRCTLLQTIFLFLTRFVFKFGKHTLSFLEMENSYTKCFVSWIFCNNFESYIISTIKSCFRIVWIATTCWITTTIYFFSMVLLSWTFCHGLFVVEFLSICNSYMNCLKSLSSKPKNSLLGCTRLQLLTFT